MHVRVLECLMCQRGFGTRKEWLSHLLETYHQSKARAQISRWGQSEKECALIVFSSFPIASIELLHFFSNGSMDLVTDFVWFESHPKVGVVQFESKCKLDEIFSICGAPEIRVNNQLLQVKRAGECLLLEWQALIPFQVDSELQEDPTSEVTEDGR
ncbi:unnamed protein product [Orchesella dallaii]|uniref:C2H2-type domain-containing protein n=1 Tax=Orchesella dallaii TaxID=48710 RepID=A0ABP1RHJ3_9HEXA